MENDFSKKSILVGLIGKTNSGKSTLMNSLIGDKVASVSHKVQTTQRRIRGIFYYDDVQIIISDSPGIFNNKTSLGRAMIKDAYEQINDNDIMILLIDGTKGIDTKVKSIAKSLEKKEKILVINKIDLLNKEQLILLIEAGAKIGFRDIFPISAVKNKGLEVLKKYLSKSSQSGGYLFEKDKVSELSNIERFEQILQEKLYKYLNKEIPYSINIETISFENKDNKYIIYQDIVVGKSSMVNIIVGRNGEKIKSIGISARQDIQRVFNVKVQLFLQVKYKEKFIKEAN